MSTFRGVNAVFFPQNVDRDSRVLHQGLYFADDGLWLMASWREDRDDLDEDASAFSQSIESIDFSDALGWLLDNGYSIADVKETLDSDPVCKDRRRVAMGIGTEIVPVCA